jgi:hypothetical protein
MDLEKAYQIAEAAVTALVNARGVESKFPFDAIWKYAKSDVPSLQRPAMQRKLLTEGYIEPTGGFTSAESESRAGSPTKEYRPGPKFGSDKKKAGARPSQSKTSVASALTKLATAMDAQGFIVLPEQLTNFYLALLSSPLVIMTGTSGTGKSRLPWLFAELTGSGYRKVAVKPQWDDNSDMFGYTSPLKTTEFIKGEFTLAIEEANKKPTIPFVVLLDEMNLAAVEHYFSDFISVSESRRRQNDSVITDPLPLDLPQPPQSPDPYANLRSMPLPQHVKVVGTANMDETTRSFSPKVLDRAFSIEFEDADLLAFPNQAAGGQIKKSEFAVLASRLADNENPVSVSEAYSKSPEICQEAASYLQTIRSILAPAGLSFAYRTRDAVCYYMYHWQRDKLDSLLPKEDALDYCVLQKVLPKIHGQGELLSGVLEQLKLWLDGTKVEPYEKSPGFIRSSAKLDRMIKRLASDGTTTYWGT